MSFNALKCFIVHFHKNISSVFPFHYSLSQYTLSSSTRCTDLGIVFSSDLSWNSHYQKISSRAYQTLYLIRRTFFATSHIEVKKLLYLSLVRSHLTYCSQLWRPSLIKDIVCLERIQRRATKFILNDYSMDYKSRLTNLGLLPLMYVFELFDILLLIKALKFPDPSFPVLEYVAFSHASTRSSSFSKLTSRRASTSLHQHAYFFRITRLWNFLPPFDLSLSYLTLKGQLKEFFHNHFNSNFNSDIPCTFHLICPCHKCKALPPKFSFK